MHRHDTSVRAMRKEGSQVRVHSMQSAESYQYCFSVVVALPSRSRLQRRKVVTSACAVRVPAVAINDAQSSSVYERVIHAVPATPRLADKYVRVYAPTIPILRKRRLQSTTIPVQQFVRYIRDDEARSHLRAARDCAFPSVPRWIFTAHGRTKPFIFLRPCRQ